MSALRRSLSLPMRRRKSNKAQTNVTLETSKLEDSTNTATANVISARSPEVGIPGVNVGRKIKASQRASYMRWVNSQLDKRSNTTLVSNLSSDLCTGVVFLQLIEVVSGERQTIIPADSLAAMRANIRSVLEFMSRNNIRIHKISTKDLLEGNEKAIMRVLLALAAHFKPDSFHRSSSKPLKRQPSLVSMVSDAAASLSEARDKTVGRSKRDKSIGETASVISLSSVASSSTSVRSAFKNRTSSTTSIPLLSPPQQQQQQQRLRGVDLPEPPPTTTYTVVERSDDITRNDDVINDNDVISETLEELNETRDALSKLQHLLLINEENTSEGGYFDDVIQQLMMKKVVCERQEEEIKSLKLQLSDLKEENLKLYGEKSGLELRHSQQERAMLALKSKVLDYEVNSKCDSTLKQLQSLVNAHVEEIQLLHEELAAKNEVLEKKENMLVKMSNDIVTKRRTEAQLHAQLESSESVASNLQVQLQDLNDRLCFYSNDNTNNPTINKLLESKMQRDKQKVMREQENMSITLNNIRRHFKKDDPVQHAFESLQQSLTSLSDLFSHATITSAKKSTNQEINNTTEVSAKSQCDSSDSGFDQNAVENRNGRELKVVYFIGKSVTPVLSSSEIELGFLTLRDFKQLINRPGLYRYFFKAFDKDFGFVMEELHFDDDVIPGHENKVVAWLEKHVGENV